ncbi:MAG TPA: IS630 family transposase [Methyloceanibacter sp.]|nr:IS630 family transposase [Methyloceanibacter sp.]
MNSSLNLTTEERQALLSLMRSRAAPAADVKRARLIMMLDEGLSWNAIGEQLPCTPDYISRWKRRFERERMAGLYARHRGSEPAEDSAKVEARVLAWTQKTPSEGSTHWSTRKLAKALGISHMMVARIWAKHGLKPHRLERYMASDDPDFETKAADVIGLYLNPPAHAAVFCVDEKTAIQALDRLDPVLPLSPGRLERHGFEYYRHGTLSLYAAFNTKTGEVLGKTAPRHTSAEFVAFLNDICARQPKRKEIHVICDNLSAHKTHRVAEFLHAHPHVHLHYTPTYSSWLNQVELWFAKIERDVIGRGIFTSVADLKRKLMRYIRQYNLAPKPVKWVYRNPIHRITTDSRVTVH